MRTKILIIILIITALFRFIGLGKNPPALNWDEIAIGWNAYSLLKTGRDEFGAFLPLTFRSFDDYKSPAYIYAVVPAIALFGKTEFAIRLPSALAGTLSVYVLFLLVKQMAAKNIQDQTQCAVWNNRVQNIGIISAAILAITPWHVHFSRVAFEANMALFFEILGAYLFIKWITAKEQQKKQIITGILSVLSFAIALYSYANARLFLALLAMGWGVIYHKELIKKKKQCLVLACLGILTAIPLILQMLQGVGLARFQATAIMNRPEIYQRNNEQAKEDFDQGKGPLGVIIHNPKIPLIKQIAQNYMDHYRYSFLFVKADLPRHQVPGFGLLYPWQLPLIIIGTIYLIKNKKYINPLPICWWLFIAPIPSALTWQVPHAIRAQLMLAPLTILSGTGLWCVLKYIQQKEIAHYQAIVKNDSSKRYTKIIRWAYPKIALTTILGIITVSGYALATSYHNNLPKEFAQDWLYGRKEMVKLVEEEKKSVSAVIVDLSIEWAYLWFLWYGDYSPQWYLQQGGTVSGGFEEERNKIENIQFKKFNFDTLHFSNDQAPQNHLFIGLPRQFRKEFVPYKKIDDLDGKPAIYIVKT